MKTMQPTVSTCRLTRLSESDALAAGALLATVFERPDRGPVERAEQLKRIGAGYIGPDAREPISFLVWEEGRVIAHALTYERSIGVVGDELPVMALAMVASDPECRGRGLGAAVVHAAFARVDAGAFPFALFQTSHKVRPFYEQIGCQVVENPIVNSLSETDPKANPFWDEVVMRYASGEGWPTGVIDLRGKGY